MRPVRTAARTPDPQRSAQDEEENDAIVLKGLTGAPHGPGCEGRGRAGAVPLRRLPVHMVVATALPRIFRKLSTRMAQTKETGHY